MKKKIDIFRGKMDRLSLLKVMAYDYFINKPAMLTRWLDRLSIYQNNLINILIREITAKGYEKGLKAGKNQLNLEKLETMNTPLITIQAKRMML